MSKGALWATSTVPAANSRKLGSTERIVGASSTMAWVMPVSRETNGVMTECSGLTRVWNSPTTSPARSLTAPISVISAVPACVPVVSRSTTTNVTS